MNLVLTTIKEPLRTSPICGPNWEKKKPANNFKKGKFLSKIEKYAKKNMVYINYYNIF